MLEKWLTLPREEFTSLMRVPLRATSEEQVPSEELSPLSPPGDSFLSANPSIQAADGAAITADSSPTSSEPAVSATLAEDSSLSNSGGTSATGGVATETGFVPIKDRKEAYRYSISQKFAMRSQLDCYNPRLPGSGVFDIKTRAVVAIRQDVYNHVVCPSSTYLICPF